MTPALRFARGFSLRRSRTLSLSACRLTALPFELCTRGLHYRAHLFQGVGAGIGNRFLDGAAHFAVAGRGGHVLPR